MSACRRVVGRIRCSLDLLVDGGCDGEGEPNRVHEVMACPYDADRCRRGLIRDYRRTLRPTAHGPMGGDDVMATWAPINEEVTVPWSLDLRALAWAAGGLGVYLGLLAADRSRIVVRGPSMAPTLLAGDLLLTIPVVGLRDRLLTPGQVVLLTDPEDECHLVVKRIVAVHEGRLWVEGDEHGHSTDSRRWGWVPATRIRRVVVRRWPQLRTPVYRTVPPDGRVVPPTGRYPQG